jgi:hypothetical protein
MSIEDYRPPKRHRFRGYTRDAWWRQAKHLVGLHEWQILQPEGATNPWLRCSWCGANRAVDR